MSNNQQQRQSAAVTISEEERRRLAAFRDILSGSSTTTEQEKQQQIDGINNNNNNGSSTTTTATGSSQQKQSGAGNANNKNAVDKFSDEEENDEELERQARAAWAQSTPDKRQDKDEIWQQQNKKNGASAEKGASPGDSKSSANVAVFSSQTTTAGWSSSPSGTVNVVSPVRKTNNAEVHQPNIVRKSAADSASKTKTGDDASGAAGGLSVQARPFVPKQQSIEKTFSPEVNVVVRGDADEGEDLTTSTTGTPSKNNNNKTTGARRAPPVGASQPKQQKDTKQIFFGSTTKDKPAEFARWMQSGGFRGPLQDPSFALNNNMPLWMHLAVLPDQCGAPSAKRVLRAWAVQFGLESVEYWTWRALVQRGVRVPVDCTEPDVTSHQPVAEYLKGTLKWYDRLSHYRENKLITEEERGSIEKLASRSRSEFLKYLQAYTASAKGAFELMATELEALEEESAKHEAEKKAKIRLGGNVTSAVPKK